MQEFSSISVSTYEPDGLTGLLNEQAAAGWSVVAIVPTGSTVTAYLTRETESSAGADTVDSSAAVDPVASDVGHVAGAVAEPSTVEPVLGVAAQATAEEPAPAPEPEPAPAVVPEPAPVQEPVAEPAPEPAAQPAAAAAAPAGWYADPSSRFELRYWDGSTWTEHVSRAGQQYTDPPVA